MGGAGEVSLDVFVVRWKKSGVETTKTSTNSPRLWQKVDRLAEQAAVRGAANGEMMWRGEGNFIITKVCFLCFNIFHHVSPFFHPFTLNMGLVLTSSSPNWATLGVLRLLLRGRTGALCEGRTEAAGPTLRFRSTPTGGGATKSRLGLFW